MSLAKLLRNLKRKMALLGAAELRERRAGG
jgi:hypothetical protein